MTQTEFCSCEDVNHSDLGAICNKERVARLVTSPNHFSKKDGKLKPGAFPISHINKVGLSLLRVDHMTEQFISEVSNAIAEKLPNETPKGLLIQSAENVRGLRNDAAARMLCLVDDPVKDVPGLPDNPAHAIAISTAILSDHDVLEIQAALKDLFSSCLCEIGSVKSSIGDMLGEITQDANLQ